MVLRANYAERLCEVVIKTGTAASTPTPPELLQPASGDYYELCLATITVNANQKYITQSAIKDTRPDSSVCGYITQLIDHLDTSVFFTQFGAFYDEFVDKSKNAYNDFTSAIDGYISGLKTKGDADLKATTDSLKEFQRTSQNAFNEWFTTVKGKMDGDVGTKLTAESEDHDNKINFLLYEVTHNDYMAPLLDSSGKPILDVGGNAIVGNWKYKYQ